MKSVLLSVFCVLVYGAALAAERVYPNADGSLRVDSAAAWGVESLDEIANDSLVFTNNATLRIAGDWSFNDLSVQNRPPTRPWADNINTVVFDATSEGETRTKITKTGADNTLLYSWTKSVYKGGDWDFGGKEIRYTGKSNDAIGHSVTLCDGARFSNVANFYLRYANSAYVAKLTLDGAGTSLDVTGNCQLNYYFPTSSGDELLVTNGASISADVFDPHGGTVLITGVGSSYTTKTRTIFDKAPGAKIVVANGATASFAQIRMGDEAGSKGLLRVTGAGTTVTANSLYCGCYSGNSNRVEVMDGALLTVGGSVYVGGDPWYTPAYAYRDNELMVSNATLHITSNVEVGHSEAVEGNAVRIQGETPMIVIDGSSTIFQYKSRLVFDIPTNGYASTVVPLTVGNKAGSPLFDETSSLELNGVAALQSNLVHRTTYTLIKDGASNKTYTLAAIPESVLERTRQSLPEKCTLKLSDDKRSLLLTVGTLRGMTLILR